jgi:hypothetical protein
MTDLNDDSAESAGAPTTPPTTPEEVDELARALGIDGQGKGKWTARVAYSKLHKVMKERDAKVKADHDAALKQHADRLSTFEAQMAQFDQMVASPEQLLGALAQVNPAYARFLQQPPQTADPAEIRTMADLQRVIDAQVQQRLAPIEHERQQRQVVEAAIPRVKQQLAEAEKWPLFAESKADILAELQKNPNAGLREAYMAVVVPRMAADRDKVRQEVLAELQSRPHTTTATSSVTGRAAEKSEPMNTADIVRQALRGLK